ncbi:hypothetical protein [Achromobacter kerstersii]|uniref:hypothetical protein n=1 Tax=Achromobacter kerstersii TaxID=1353890 RepID=UPI003CFE1E25
MEISERLKTWAKRIKRDGLTLWFAGKHPQPNRCSADRDGVGNRGRGCMVLVRALSLKFALGWVRQGRPRVNRTLHNTHYAHYA